MRGPGPYQATREVEHEARRSWNELARYENSIAVDRAGASTVSFDSSSRTVPLLTSRRECIPTIPIAGSLRKSFRLNIAR